MRKLSQAELKAMVRMLKRAKIRIYAGYDFGICDALNPTYFPIEIKLRGYLVEWILQMLGGRAWLEDWIREERGFYPNKKQLKQIRLKWIDWMIGELKKEIK